MGAREYRRLVGIVYGQTGAGKTVLARALFAERVKSLGPRASGIIVDTLEEHADLPALSLDSVENYLDMDSYGPATTKPRLVRVLIEDDEQFDAFASDLENTYTAPRDGHPVRGPVTLMIDEVSYWTSPNKSTAGLSRLIRYGRHWKVDLIGVARRPAETSRELSAQSTALYIVGGLVEPRDQAYMRQILPPEALSKSVNLPDYHYLRFESKGTYAVCPPVKII